MDPFLGGPFPRPFMRPWGPRMGPRGPFPGPMGPRGPFPRPGGPFARPGRPMMAPRGPRPPMMPPGPPMMPCGPMGPPGPCGPTLIPRDRLRKRLLDKSHIRSTDYQIRQPDLRYIAKGYIRIANKKPIQILDSRDVKPLIEEAKEEDKAVALVVKLGETYGQERLNKGIIKLAEKRQWVKKHNEETWTCVIAGKREHPMDEYDLNNYPCLVCEKMFHSPNTFAEHLESTHHSILMCDFIEKQSFLYQFLLTNLRLVQQQTLSAVHEKSATDEMYSNMRQNLARQLKNIYGVCWMCGEAAETFEDYIAHIHWVPHIKKIQDIEAKNRENFSKHFPPLTPLISGPRENALNRKTPRSYPSDDEYTRELQVKRMCSLIRYTRKDDPMVMYDPAIPAVSDVEELERPIEFLCNVCGIDPLDSALEALEHFRSREHYDKYLKHLAAEPTKEDTEAEAESKKIEDEQKKKKKGPWTESDLESDDDDDDDDDDDNDNDNDELNKSNIEGEKREGETMDFAEHTEEDTTQQQQQDREEKETQEDSDSDDQNTSFRARKRKAEFDHEQRHQEQQQQQIVAPVAEVAPVKEALVVPEEEDEEELVSPVVAEMVALVVGDDDDDDVVEEVEEVEVKEVEEVEDEVRPVRGNRSGRSSRRAETPVKTPAPKARATPARSSRRKAAVVEEKEEEIEEVEEVPVTRGRPKRSSRKSYK